jgi:8-oxo-dGTP pyrophosphatase MutT (NUDIX family)
MPSSQSSRVQFHIPLSLQHLSVPLYTFLQENPHVDRLAVGGLIFCDKSSAKYSPRLLLLQRASFGCSFPYAWEIPGGTCEYTDETILHSLVREVYEATGLRVTRFVAQVGSMDYLVLKGVRWAKICFSIEVKATMGRDEMGDIAVRIDGMEHRDYRWAVSSDVELVSVMTEGQRDVMRTGFGHLRGYY